VHFQPHLSIETCNFSELLFHYLRRSFFSGSSHHYAIKHRKCDNATFVALTQNTHHNFTFEKLKSVSNSGR
jgi:hypothetical protein